MENEQPPKDRSDLSELPPRERLRGSVDRLANHEGGDTPDIIRSGMIRLGRENSLVGRIIGVAEHVDVEARLLLPDYISELALYGRRGNMVESLMLGNRDDSILIVRKGKKTFAVPDEEADAYIMGFTYRHEILRPKTQLLE